MLYLLGQFFEPYFGPFRLFKSHLLLSGLGLSAGFFLTLFLLPKFYKLLPSDRGRQFAAESHAAIGKPTGSGSVFISIFIILALLVTPLDWKIFLLLAITFLNMISGFLDDKSITAWGEYKKGVIDLLLAVASAMILCGCSDITVWLPFTKVMFTLSPFIFVPLATILIWASINATNCSDGVDGLSGTLVLIALISLGGFLYFIVGHQLISNYLLVPHYHDAAKYSIMTLTLAGTLAGYLWHNANPSHVLMGDAGSRAIGFFIGIIVIKTGNPFIILIVASVLLINGGTGLIKVALLRFFKISIFKTIRFPLHDHFRINKKWSNTQVLIRFTLIQIIIIIVLLALIIKIR